MLKYVKTKPIKAVVLKMSVKDKPYVFEVEKSAFDRASLLEVDLWKMAYGGGNQCYVAKIAGSVVGYVIFEVTDSYAAILRIAVSKDVQRFGVGTSLIQSLKELDGIENIDVFCPENNLGLQLLLKKEGFWAQSKINSRYRNRKTLVTQIEDGQLKYYMVCGTDSHSETNGFKNHI